MVALLLSILSTLGEPNLFPKMEKVTVTFPVALGLQNSASDCHLNTMARL